MFIRINVDYFFSSKRNTHFGIFFTQSESVSHRETHAVTSQSTPSAGLKSWTDVSTGTDLLHLGEFFDILTFFNQIMLEYLSHLQQKFVIWRRSMILKRFHRKSGLICDNLFSRHVLELGLTCSSAPWTWHIFITDVFIQIIFLDVHVYCELWLQHSRLNQKEICLICEVILMYSGQWWQRADINVTSISQFYVL